MASLKPNKPQNFDGKKDEFTAGALLHQVKQYLTLVQIETILILMSLQKSLSPQHFCLERLQLGGILA